MRCEDGWLAEMLGGGSDSCHSLCRAVWVAGNNIGDDGLRHLGAGLAAAGLSQLTSLDLSCESAFLPSWGGLGCCSLGTADGAVAELCGVRMGGWLRC